MAFKYLVKIGISAGTRKTSPLPYNGVGLRWCDRRFVD